MSVEIDSLEIQIEASANEASAGIDKLTSALQRLKAVTKGGAGLTAVKNQLEKLNIALSGVNIDAGKIGRVAEALESLSTVQKASGLISTVNALKKLPEITSALDKADLDHFAVQMERVATAVRPLATEMQKVSNGFAAFPIRIQKVISSNVGLAASNKKTAKSFGVLGTGINSTALKFGVYAAVLSRVVKTVAGWVKESTEYVENINLFTVSMGKYAEEATRYGQHVQEAMGIDFSEWSRNQGIFMQIATGFGVVEDKAYTMSRGLTQIAYDMSSYFNSDITTALEKVQAGISGELEPLRRWGYALDAATLQQVAYRNGIQQSINTMTQAQKSQIRYIAIMEQSKNVMGDMSRTLVTPANAMRILQQQTTQLTRALGNMFIPMLITVIPYVQAVVKVLTQAAQAVAKLLGYELPTIDYSGMNGLPAIAADAEDGFSGAAGAAKELKNNLMGIDELNVISQQVPANGEGGGTGIGGDLGLDLSAWDYDFLGEIDDKVNVIADSIKSKIEPVISWMKENMDIVKGIVLGIGGGILAWKLANGFVNGISGLVGNLKTISSMVLTIAGIAAIAGGAFDAWKNGVDWQNLLFMLGGTAALVAGLAITLGPLGAAIGLLVGGVALLAVGLHDWISKGQLSTETFWMLEAGILAVGGALAILISPWILVVAAVAAAALAVYKYWDEIKAFFIGVWDGIVDIWNTCADWMKAHVIDPVVGFFKGLWESVSGFFKNLWDDIVGIWNAVATWFDEHVIQPIISLFAPIVEGISTFFKGCWLIVQAVWVVVSTWFHDKVIEPTVNFFKGFWESVSGFFKSLWNDVVTVWETVSEWFNTKVIEPVVGWFKGAWTSISGFFSQLWQDIKGVWSAVASWFQSTVIEPVVSFFSQAWENIQGAFEKAFKAIGNFAVSIFNNVIGAVEGVINFFVDGIRGLIGGFNRVVEWAADVLGTNWSGLQMPSHVSLGRIEYFATGGFPEDGLFFANSRELVGQFSNGKTAVANNEQIISGITAGVESANAQQNTLLREQNELLRALLEKDTAVHIGDRDIGRANDRYVRNRGVNTSKGAYANAY